MSQEPKVTRFGALPLIDSELATKAYVDSSSGGGQTFLKVVKSVDETINNSDTLQDDDELFGALPINLTYTFLCVIYGTATGFADMKFTFTVPSGASGTFGNGVLAYFNGTGTDAYGVSRAVSSSGTKQYVTCGRVIMGATAGDLNFQWAQNNIEVSDATVFAGSLLLVWQE